MRRRKKIFVILLVLLIALPITLLVSCYADNMKISYYTDGNGYIRGKINQNIPLGASAEKVCAIANEGYEFVSWSDGVTDKDREDINVRTSFSVCAIFKRITISVNYQALGGGRIDGPSEQFVLFGENALPVTAIADEGYKFDGWSDGIETATRQDLEIKENVLYNAVFAITINYIVKFLTSDGGRVEGSNIQEVESGADSLFVTAIPNESYEFIGWTDGVKERHRNIKNVSENKSVTALFERVQQSYTYEYNGGTSSNGEKTVLISKINISELQLSIPKREGYSFGGWYLDWHLSTRASDAMGHMLIGKEILKYDSAKLYAKWIPHIVKKFNILMINVTKISAQLNTFDNRVININYCQSEIERQIHQEAATLFSNYLNAIFNGEVVFNVDTYDTTVALTKANFTTAQSLDFLSYGIFPEKVPEVKQLEDKYDTIITTFNLEDYSFQLHNITGSTMGKYAYLHAEEMWGVFIRNGYPIEWIIDKQRPDYNLIWGSVMESYLHEFIHTIESRVETVCSYHEAVKQYSYQIGGLKNEIDIERMYLTNTLKISGVYVGIPINIWNKFNKGEQK
jgi:hypothetical protein